MPNLLDIVDRVKARHATLEIGNLGRLDDTATGKLMATMFGAIAAFEREIMLERQREGICGQGCRQIQRPDTDRTVTECRGASARRRGR